MLFVQGHYPVGAVNGVRLPLAGNGRVADAGIRITDNPRVTKQLLFDTLPKSLFIRKCKASSPWGDGWEGVICYLWAALAFPSLPNNSYRSMLQYDSSVSESPVLGLQSKSAADSPRRSEDSLNDSNLPLLGPGTDPDPSSQSDDTPRCLQNTNSASHPIDCNGFESLGAPFPPVRGKARAPAPVDIFDVPDSPPSKPAQLIIDFQFV